MKNFILILSLLLVGLTGYSQTVTTGSPIIKLLPLVQDVNKNGGTIAKGDTVKLTLNWTNSTSTIRTIYLDFQHQIGALDLLDVEFPTAGAQGAALPTGTQTSFTNYYYPYYNWLNRTDVDNNTEDGLLNAQRAQYQYIQGQQPAINRVTLTFATPNGNVTNLKDGDLAYLRFKIKEVAAGYSYDSVYMNFAYGWPTSGGQTTIKMPRANASSWIDVSSLSNALIKGNLKLNTNLISVYQPKVNIKDSISNTSVGSFAAAASTGIFNVASQVMANKAYKVSVYIPSDSLPAILAKAITVSDYTSALAEWNKQNLDGTLTNQTIASGIGLFAADVNKDKKFDGADLALLFAQAIGYDTILTATAGSSMYDLPVFLDNVYDTLTYKGWQALDDVNTINFKTADTAKTLNLKYIIPGDINRSHSSARTQATGVTTYSANGLRLNISSVANGYINAENVFAGGINVSLDNLTVTSNNIEIPFSIDTKGNNVSALQFEVAYDATKVKFEEIKSEVPNTWFVFVNPRDGVLRFGAIDKELKTPIKGASAPFKLKFSSIGNGVDINTKIKVTQNMDASDNKGNQLGINLNTTTIKLTGYNNFN